jgi:hypothetical protein
MLTAAAGAGVQSGDLYEPGGWLRLRGPVRKCALEPCCTNQSARTMLWAESERAVGEFRP